MNAPLGSIYNLVVPMFKGSFVKKRKTLVIKFSLINFP
jgi:hypothetical protein